MSELPPQIFYGDEHPMWDWSGWQPRRCSDRGPVEGNTHVGKCQMCGQAPLRFVHQFEHPDFVPPPGGDPWVEIGGKSCVYRLCPEYNWEKAERDATKRREAYDSKPCKSIIGDHCLLGNYFWRIVNTKLGYRWWVYGEKIKTWGVDCFPTWEEAHADLYDYLDRRYYSLLEKGGEFNPNLGLAEIDLHCSNWTFTKLSEGRYERKQTFQFDPEQREYRCLIQQQNVWKIELWLPSGVGFERFENQSTDPVTAKIVSLEMFRKEMTRIIYERAGLETPDSEFLSVEGERKVVKLRHDEAETWFAGKEERRKAAEAMAEQRRKAAEAAVAAEEQRRKAEEDRKRAEALKDLQVARNVIDGHCADWFDYWVRTGAATIMKIFSILELPKTKCEIIRWAPGYKVSLSLDGKEDSKVAFSGEAPTLPEAHDLARNAYLSVATRLAEEKAGVELTAPRLTMAAEAKYRQKVTELRIKAEAEAEALRLKEEAEAEAKRIKDIADAEQNRLNAEKAAKAEAECKLREKADRKAKGEAKKQEKAEWLVHTMPDYFAWEKQLCDNFQESNDLWLAERAGQREAYMDKRKSNTREFYQLLERGRKNFKLPFKALSNSTTYSINEVKEILAEHGLFAENRPSGVPILFSNSENK